MWVCVCLSSALWKNGRSGPDAVWHGRSDGSVDGAGSGPIVGFGDRSTGRDNFGANMGNPIVINGDFLLLGIPIVPLQGCCLNS